MRTGMIVAGMLLCIAQASAQPDCRPFFRGTKTLYEPAAPAEETAAPPKGYRPAFICYAGRHGARHPTNIKELKRLKALLVKADSAGALAPEGIKLLKMTTNLWKVEQGYTMGDITQRGEQEQAGIAQRMKAVYPILTADNFKVCTTPQARTRQSAKAFMRGLGYSYPAGTARLNEADTVALRFYDLSPAYSRFEKSAGPEAAVNKMMEAPETAVVVSSVIHRLFEKSYADKMLGSTAAAASFALSLFGIAAIEKGMQHEIEAAGVSFKDADMTALFTCREMEQLEAVADAKDFLVKGPGMNASGIQVKIAAPLLLDFVESTDAAASGKDTNKAVLRFTHAEAIAPLAALMEIEGAAAAATDLPSYENVWQAGRVIPFSANIQWILFARPGRESLVKILLNERPVRIPVKGAGRYPYYSWAAVKDYYTQKLAVMGVRPGVDVYRWLQTTGL